MSVKRERVEAALAGQVMGRPPLSMWHHFYEREETADGLAEATLDFQRRFDWDFMKVNPRAQYHVEDWGARYHYTGDPYLAPTPTHFPVGSAEDWGMLKPLDPRQGSLGEHLHALRLIARGLNGKVPFVMTVFTPLAIAARLVESDQVMLEYLREHPKEVYTALDVITETFRTFVTECLSVGADGIFFATTHWASHDLLTDEEYQEFGRPYDLRVLEAAKDATFNILHVCQSHNMLRSLADYPIHALNWESRDDTNPSLKEARDFTGLPLIGGVGREALRDGQPKDVAAHVQDAVAQTGGRGLLVGPGCSISPRCPEANLRTLHQALAKGAP